MGHFAIYVRRLFGWRYISSRSLHSAADEAQEGRNSCPLLRSCFIGSCRVGVSKRFSRSISLAVYMLYTHFILADQISYRSYVCSVYCMRSLAVCYSLYLPSHFTVLQQRPDHHTGNRHALHLMISVWVLLRPLLTITSKMKETGPTVYSPYPRRPERLTVCR